MSLHRARSNNNPLALQPASVMQRLVAGGATAVFGNSVDTLLMSDGVQFTQATLSKRPMATTVNGWPAMQFDGVDDALVASGDLVGTGDVTIVAVIRPTGLGAGSAGRILSNGQFGIYQATTERLTVSSDSGTTSLTSANNSVQLNRKYVLVITRSATGVASIWLNGSLLTSGASGTPAAGSDTYVGNRAAGDRAFQGMISYLSIHKRILSVPEIQALTRYLSQNRAPDTWSFSVSAGTFNVAISNAGTTTWQLPDGTTTTTATGVALNTTLTQGQVNATAAFSNASSTLIVPGPSTAFSPMRFSDLPVGLKSIGYSATMPLIVGKLSELPRGMDGQLYIYVPHSSSVITGSLAELPIGLSSSVCLTTLGNSSQITGSLADLPRGLQSSAYLLNLGYASQITGSLADLPRGLAGTVQLSGLGTNSQITGSLADLPRGLAVTVYLTALGTNSQITGSPADVTGARLTSLYIFGEGVTEVSGSVTPERLSPNVSVVRLYDCNFSPADTDNNIIALNTSLGAGTGASPRTAVFETNRTSASDAALASLQSKGWTVTFA